MSTRFVLWCLLLVLPAAVGAQERNAACRADVEQYCSQSKASVQQATDCLLDHQNDVSDACYDSLKKRADVQRGMKACKQDSDAFCKGIEPGGGRIVRCLMEHQKDVSDDCYDMLSKRGKGGKS